MGIFSFITGGLIGGLYDNQQKKASKAAVKAVQDAADKNTALADKVYTQTRNDFAPGRAAYGTGISELYRELGLSPPTSPQGAPGAAPTASQGFDPRAGAGGDPRAAAAPQGVDWQAYWDQNPDLAANNASTPTVDLTGDGRIDDQDRAAQHWQQFGQTENRALPMNPETGAPGGPGADPSQANYGAGPEPGPFVQGDRPQYEQFKDPGSAPAFAFDFKADPGYAWRQQEAARGGNAAYGAKGLLKSGGAIKAAQDRSYNLADQSYNTAYDQYLQKLAGDRAQFNADRSANFNIYDTGRKFDESNYRYGNDFNYGESRDQRGDFEADRGFGAGREDQRISNIFGLTTLGQNAVAGTGTAGNVFTSAATAANNNVASARANKAIYDNQNSFFNQGLQFAAGAAGRSSGGF
jgi:hypothetical protein